MHAEWPASALKQWPSVTDPATGQLSFRGPRIKMGLSEGVPGSIRPDHNGRADYFGASVNKAARLMDAGKRGGRERGGQGEWRDKSRWEARGAERANCQRTGLSWPGIKWGQARWPGPSTDPLMQATGWIQTNTADR